MLGERCRRSGWKCCSGPRAWLNRWAYTLMEPAHSITGKHFYFKPSHYLGREFVTADMHLSGVEFFSYLMDKRKFLMQPGSIARVISTL